MKRSGFSLLEMLIVITLLGLLAALSFPFYNPLVARHNIASARDTVVRSLHRTQLLSMAMANDTTWGIHFEAGKVVIFKGATYIGRDAAYDQVNTLASNITFSGLNDFIFTKFDGYPASTGTITITGGNSETKTITLNAKGMVSY